MFLIILIMAGGILAGRLLRNHKLTFLSKLINLLIWILLFLLGVEVGGDERIVKGMATLGAEAIIVAVAGVIGSALLAWGLWKWVKSNKKEGKG